MLTTSVIKWFVICVVMIKCISASIKVTVDAKLKKADAYGSDLVIISDKERNAFGIDDFGLKAALKVAFGKRPDDVFVRSPTPWRDLYQTYGWKQVKRTLKSTAVKLISSSVEFVILNSKNFENNATLPADYHTNIFKEEFCVVSHTWNKSRNLNSGINLSYNINFPIDYLDASMSMTYKNSWGNSKSIRQLVRIGSISDVKFTVPPRTKATIALVAEKVNMEVQIDYDATLEGQAALNYGIPYKGHHFWGYEINTILIKNNKSSSITSNEILRLSYFKKPKIIVQDRVSKNNIVSVNTVIDVVEEFLNFN